MGKPDHPRESGSRTALRVLLCLRRTPAGGERDCVERQRNPVSGCSESAPLLQSVLSVSSAPDPEFCHDPFPEKPDVDKKDRTHVPPFSSGQTALLSF